MINPRMKAFMEYIITSHIDTTDILFSNTNLDFVNTLGKNVNNKFGMDKYGLIIRKNDFGKKNSASGWKYDTDNNVVNIHVCNVISRTDTEIFEDTIDIIYKMFSMTFKSNRTTLSKIYNTIYPELYTKTQN